jgi:shikimate dehydrogenase
MDSRPPVIRLAVFGSPIGQSLSPRIHSMFGAQFGLNVHYRAIEATHTSFPGLLRTLEEEGGRGCNVTAPLKRDAWQLAGRCSDAAARACAANVLVFRNGDGWFADNTDGRGLVDDLQSQPGSGLANARVCLLGAGGAAAGVLGALLQAGAQAIVIANRTLERAAELAARHADLGAIEPCTPDGIGARGPFDLFVNATSLGHTDSAPLIDRRWLTAGGLCYDLNYGPAAGPLRDVCAAAGIRYSDGLGMLVGQAALSFELWTGQRPEAGPVLEALRET